jgi:hypothetical protein
MIVNNISKTVLGTALLMAVSSTSAIAHNVEVAGDVAGTWHVEPDHNPRSGEPATVWIALTRKGGEVLPLSQASCQLSVFSQPYTEGDKPLLQPELKATLAVSAKQRAVEQYAGIPGADVVFPQPGLYEMELSCTPRAEGTFAAFEMRSPVTVVGGVPSPSASPPIENLVGTAEGVDEPPGINWGITIAGAAIGVAVGIAIWVALRKKA